MQDVKIYGVKDVKILFKKKKIAKDVLHSKGSLHVERFPRFLACRLPAALSGQLLASQVGLTIISIYIYIYIERERDIEICVCTHTCIYIYIYTYIYVEREIQIRTIYVATNHRTSRICQLHMQLCCVFRVKSLNVGC